MRKYWHVINIGIQNNLTYRFNFLARTVFGLIPLVAMLYVWKPERDIEEIRLAVEQHSVAAAPGLLREGYIILAGVPHPAPQTAHRATQTRS